MHECEINKERKCTQQGEIFQHLSEIHPDIREILAPEQRRTNSDLVKCETIIFTALTQYLITFKSGQTTYQPMTFS